VLGEHRFALLGWTDHQVIMLSGSGALKASLRVFPALYVMETTGSLENPHRLLTFLNKLHYDF